MVPSNLLAHHYPGRKEYVGTSAYLLKSGHGSRGFRNGSLKLPVAAFILAWGVTAIPGISSITRRKVPRGRTVVGSTTIHVRVWRGVVAAVWVFIATTRGRVVIDRSAARRRSVPGAVVVVVAAWASLAVSVTVPVPAWTKPSGRRATSVPVLTRRVRSAARRARTVTAISRDIGLGLCLVSRKD